MVDTNPGWALSAGQLSCGPSEPREQTGNPGPPAGLSEGVQLPELGEETDESRAPTEKKVGGSSEPEASQGRKPLDTIPGFPSRAPEPIPGEPLAALPATSMDAGDPELSADQDIGVAASPIPAHQSPGPESQSPPPAESQGEGGGPAGRLGSTTQQSLQAVEEPPFTIVRRREQDPTPKVPILYREYAYAVPKGTSRSAVQVLLWARFRDVVAALETRSPGKFVQLGVFDHDFSDRPQRPPLATLVWKDWRGEPVVSLGADKAARRADAVQVLPHTAVSEPGPPPAQPGVENGEAESGEGRPVPSSRIVVIGPAEDEFDAARPIVAGDPVRSESPPSELVSAPTEMAPTLSAPSTRLADVSTAGDPGAKEPAATEHSEAKEASAVGSPQAEGSRPAEGSFPADVGAVRVGASDGEVPRGARDTLPSRPPAAITQALESMPPSSRRRQPGEDLIGELFETMHALHFLRDVVSGCDFVVQAIQNTLPCAVALVHVYDINSRRFVVVRASGPGAKGLILHQTPDQDPLFRACMRKSVSTRQDDVSRHPWYSGGRWDLLPVKPTAALFGPVALHGRYLGAIELANPLGGGPFYQTEANGLDYICEQFAEFLSQRPIVLDPEVVAPK